MPEILHSTVLIDSDTNVNRGNWSIDSSMVDPSSGTWNIQNHVLHGGRQEGSQLLTINNGMMQVNLIPTRGMGVASVIAGDMRLGWDSPIKEIVHPSFINLESRNGLGWLEGFNEWMCRCGLEFSGHPGTDEFIDNVGAKNTMMLSLHGKIANIPCRHADVTVERENGAVRIIVRSTVEERVFHGPKLELQSEIIIDIGTTTFRIHDTVINRSSCNQEFQMLYHCNFGSPLLEEGAKLVAPVATNTPFNDRAAEGLSRYNVYEKAQPGFIEQVYKMTLKSDAQKQTGVLLHNASSTRGASMYFNADELPCFTLWKNTDAAEDGYVTGLEPGTSFPHNRRMERSEGRVPVLPPNSSQSFNLAVSLHLTPEDVQTTKQNIESI